MKWENTNKVFESTIELFKTKVFLIYWEECVNCVLGSVLRYVHLELWKLIKKYYLFILLVKCE
ncbi:hypothetical protein NQ930_09650 [Clostridioides difficile]|nr:hypothetical protein [Clostridioides difficile]CCL43982.1 hypothetical protein BN177_70013 [Clostridioides difficile E24]CCL44253.1 hypothetical protein BN178_130014 [Clostridioides difficile T42]CCL48145.1 hypothetical protein BN179_110013 [Clostridioides difficile T6]CCL52314.1 hypothetical protein BN180_110013 [Clostridioides difficile E14]CCL56179.1 hypothetical protein BN181_120006 [Clostridioides difficile T17]